LKWYQESVNQHKLAYQESVNQHKLSYQESVNQHKLGYQESVKQHKLGSAPLAMPDFKLSTQSGNPPAQFYALST